MTLPIPDPAALAHSARLTQHIRQKIETAGGHISFAHFMELALYAPGLGYYSAGSHKLGKGGDFVTAPEISPLFARCIARQIQPIFAEIDAKNILEIGAGSGIFARDVLHELNELNQLPKNYFILEVSAELRERQKQFLQQTCPTFFSRIIWLDTLPQDFSGVIFANEVMDAMPVHCFQQNQERSVTWKNNQFAWLLTPPEDALAKRLELLQLEHPFPEGYQSEINLMLPAWIHSLADTLKKGLILLIDYGYGRSEYYHPDRSRGTLKCFYQHHHHDDPFQYVGLQDITAHVDFTTVVESAMDAGLSLGGYATQAAFLLSCGLTEIADKNQLSTIDQYHQGQAIKTLTLPAQMGEIVKVMALTLDVEQPLLGFQLQDRRRDL